jgi:hypothetical protein
MRNRSLFRADLMLPVVLAIFMSAASEGAQTAPPPRPPPNRAPVVTLTSSCGPNVTTGQACAITVSATDQDRNLARIDLNWNDGTPVDSRMVGGDQASATFSRSFSAVQTMRWSVTAVDSAGVASSELSGTLSVTAPPSSLPLQPPPSSPAPAPAPAANASTSAASEQELASLVVMIRGTVGEKSVVGAGVIFGVASDRLYIATANHVVRGERSLGGEAELGRVQVQLRWLRGEWQSAKVLDESFDEALDLAVITVAGASQLAVPKLPWGSLVTPDALVPGESVIPIGYPGGRPWFMPRQPHVVSTIEPQVIKTEGDLAPGYSGGALVTRDWGVAGILLNIGSLVNDVLRIDVALKRIRDWGHEVDATFKERPKATEAGTDPSATLARDRQEAESFVGRWIGATMSRDIQTLLNMAEMPFYFDQEILVRREDLESRLNPSGARAANNLSDWKIQSIRAITVGELKAKGEEAKRDRVLGRLSMADSDWQVVVLMTVPGGSTPRTEGAVFFVRKIGGVMKIVGLWD